MITHRPLTLIRRAVALGVAALALAGCVAPIEDAVAQTPPVAAPVPATVDVEVMVVHANNTTRTVDARLERLLPHLRHLTYTGYQVLDTRQEALAPSAEATFPVVGDRRLKVELVDHDATNARMRIQMFNPSGRILDSTVTIRRNRTFIVMGPTHEQGVLVLPITARY